MFSKFDAPSHNFTTGCTEAAKPEAFNSGFSCDCIIAIAFRANESGSSLELEKDPTPLIS